MKKKFAVFLFFAFAFTIFLFSCKKSEHNNLLEKVKAKGELVIATEGVWAPWTFRNEKNELVGYDIDISKEICSRLGVKARFVELEWERIFESLLNGSCDIAANGIGVTSERAGSFYFSQPYAYSKTVLIVRNENKRINSFKDLQGMSSANALGSTYCDIAESYGAIIIAVDTFEETMDLLLGSRVDSTINSDVCFYYYMKNHPDAKIRIAETSNVVIPVAIPCVREVENLPLLAAINTILTEMGVDGTLSQLSKKYFKKDITK